MSPPAPIWRSPTGSDQRCFRAERSGHRIWAVAPGGGPRVVAGTGNGYRDAGGADSQVRFPSDVAVADDGTCYVRIDRLGRSVTPLRLGGPPWPSAVATVDAPRSPWPTRPSAATSLPFGWVALVGTAAVEQPDATAASAVYPPATAEISRRRKELAPEIHAALENFSRSVFRSGALPEKAKQLIAVAVAHTTQCP